MKSIKWGLTFLGLFALLGGCAPQEVTTPAPTLAPVEPATAIPGLTVDAIKNMTLTLPVSGRTVAFVNGKFSDTSAQTPLDAGIADQVTFADVNMDGLEDAVIITWENTGGSGTFESVMVVYNLDGIPFQDGSEFLGDRVKVNNVTVNGQEVVVDMLVQGPNDGMCCPSQPVTATYQHMEDALVLASITSKTADGQDRIITITEPQSFTEASGAVQVKGSVTIAPFENNLVYSVVDWDGNELAKGPCMVTAAEMGGPGTFDLPVDLSGIASGTEVRLSLSDLSMADGSTLAMDSVFLRVK